MGWQTVGGTVLNCHPGTVRMHLFVLFEMCQNLGMAQYGSQEWMVSPPKISFLVLTSTPHPRPNSFSLRVNLFRWGSHGSSVFLTRHTNLYMPTDTYWLVVGTFGLCFHNIGNFIIPTDEPHHFSEGLNEAPSSLSWQPEETMPPTSIGRIRAAATACQANSKKISGMAGIKF